ncbi:MAG: putative amino acid transporter, rane protein [Pedosphaera sp.]|nr:putative amino acid transporter, rane protein [Pedosphaera sp.]
MSWLKYFTAANEPGAPPPPLSVRALNFAIAFLLIALIFFFAFHQVNYHWDWSAIYKYRQKFIQGWLTTILISLAALALSVGIGLFFALAQRSHFLPLRYFSKLYVEVVRGTPLLVQILIFFYVVANAFGVSNRYLVGVLTLSFFSGAYISEVIRAGIESVGKSQLESARAIGLTRAQTYRYVVFPQALRQTLPPLAGQFVSLIKDSSLLSIISISEFTLNAQEVNAYTFSTLESYIPLAVGYLVLTLPISLWTRRLEQRHRYET